MASEPERSLAESDPNFVPDQDADERSLIDDVRDLVDDGFAAFEAEVAFQKSRAGFAAQGIKSIAILGTFAGLLVFFALVALTVGLVFALTPLLTALGATAAVVLAYLLIAGLLAYIALSRWKAMIAALTGKGAEA